MNLSLLELAQLMLRFPGVLPSLVASAAISILSAWQLRAKGKLFASVAGIAMFLWLVSLVATLIPDLLSETSRMPASTSAAFDSIERCVDSTWPSDMWSALNSLDGRANLLLFFLPGMVGVLAIGRPLAVGMALCLQSAVTEIVQGIFAGSSCQATDFITNTLGTVAGVICGICLRQAIDSARMHRWGLM